MWRFIGTLSLKTKKGRMIMESRKTPYTEAELCVVDFEKLDIVTASGETGDSFEWVDKDPNSWDS